MSNRSTVAKLYQGAACVVVCCVCLCACGVGSPSVGQQTDASALRARDSVDSVSDARTPTASPTRVKLYLPEASGEVVYAGEGITIDASHTDCGYVMVKSEPRENRLKTRVGTIAYNYYYDLASDDTYAVFPFQQGSGAYTIRVMENVQDDLYALLYAAELNVKLANENDPFLYPNQYVNFNADTKAVAKAYLLVGDLTDETQIVKAVYGFVTNLMTYDAEKAKRADTGELNGYLPDVDETLETGKGICFDYSVLLATMLRAKGIPTKVVIGVVSPENILHAWNRVLLNGEWILYDATLDKTGHRETDYAPEREY